MRPELQLIALVIDYRALLKVDGLAAVVHLDSHPGSLGGVLVLLVAQRLLLEVSRGTLESDGVALIQTEFPLS